MALSVSINKDNTLSINNNEVSIILDYSDFQNLCEIQSDVRETFDTENDLNAVFTLDKTELAVSLDNKNKPIFQFVTRFDNRLLMSLDLDQYKLLEKHFTSFETLEGYKIMKNILKGHAKNKLQQYCKECNECQENQLAHDCVINTKLCAERYLREIDSHLQDEISLRVDQFLWRTDLDAILPPFLFTKLLSEVACQNGYIIELPFFVYERLRFLELTFIINDILAEWD
jgi:hypothetical protein